MHPNTIMGAVDERRLASWWMGGVASAAACCFTQPLDTLKVHMQTQSPPRLSMYQLTVTIIKHEGFMALNNGLSAAVVRQLTYSMFRFAFYEGSKQYLAPDGERVPFYQKVAIAAVGGSIGGFVGTPADLINVRMQNDARYPADQRRNYRHVFDGWARVCREEGFGRLFSGASSAMGRSVGMTVGQLVFYDQCKVFLTERGMEDNLITHFSASLFAGAAATTLTQPMDVIKTVTMNAKPGEFKNMWHIIKFLSKQGPNGFFKGFVLRFVRLAPHTILTFVFFEQLRLNFGIVHQKHEGT